MQDTDQWHLVEQSSGRLMRQFRLPDNVNVDDISLKLENGVLTVNAPKIKPEAVSNGDVKSIYIYAITSSSPILLETLIVIHSSLIH